MVVVRPVESEDVVQEDVRWETDAVVRHPAVPPPPGSISAQFVEITSEDGHLRSVYDKDADVAYVQIQEHRYGHGELVDGNNKILEYDPEGQVHAIQFLNCSDGVNMREVPEELQEEATRTLERLGIMSGHHGQG